MAGRGQAHQLGHGDEEPLVAGLTGPGDVTAGERTLDLEPVAVVETVEQGGVLAAQLAEGLEHRGVGPRALDRRCRAATGAPLPLSRQRLGQPEDCRLADARDSREQQRGAPSAVGAVHRGADLVAHSSSADQPDAAVGLPGLPGLLLQPGPQPLRLRARRGAQLAEQGAVEALELPQRRACVAPVGVLADQREVGPLVGRAPPRAASSQRPAWRSRSSRSTWTASRDSSTQGS